MDRQIIVIIAILVAGVILFAGTRAFEVERPATSRDSSLSLPSFSLPSLQILPLGDAVVAAEAWTTFQNYLAFARTHNLAGVRNLSHQISATCSDPSKEEQCFALMDSVYAIASPFEPSEFKYVEADERQIIMYTDGPTVAILYFTRDDTGTIKVLGMRFCLEDETVQKRCVEIGSIKRDENGNGWWDSVETLFYPDVSVGTPTS